MLLGEVKIFALSDPLASVAADGSLSSVHTIAARVGNSF